MANKPKNKVSLPKPQPRPLDQISASYQELVSRAGQAQYHIYVYTKDLERINEGLMSLNQEAAARNELDAKAKANEKPEEV